MIEIYTDGGCDNAASKIGAWAFVVLKDGTLLHKESSHEIKTTNNRVEYIASIKALKWVKGNLPMDDVIVYTDSNLLVRTAMEWRLGWKRKGWVKGKKSEIKNLDLVLEIDKLCESMSVKYVWIKGHSGIEWNEYVDNMCTEVLSSYGIVVKDYSHHHRPKQTLLRQPSPELRDEKKQLEIEEKALNRLKHERQAIQARIRKQEALLAQEKQALDALKFKAPTADFRPITHSRKYTIGGL